MGQTITLTGEDGFRLAAYQAEPATTPKGGVVVIQEIFGVNEHIRDVTDGYAAAGYLAIAPALFDRVERGVELGYDAEGIEQGVAIARGKVDFATAITDIATAARAVAHAGKVGVVGYCWGGMLATATAIRSGDVVSAAVGYYGGGAVNLIDRQPAVPLMLHFGENDHAIPLSDVEKMREAWPQAIVHIYEGAEHGFNCDRRGSFNAPAAELARQRTLAFFGEKLA